MFLPCICCFIIRELDSAFVDTVNTLVPEDGSIPTFIFVDSDTAGNYVFHHGIWVVVVPEAQCVAAGYTDLGWHKPVTALEKCLLTLARRFSNMGVPHLDFQNAWIIEDDCRFSSPAKFRELVLGTPAEPELVATYVEPRTTANNSWMNWHYAEKYFAPGVAHHKSFNAFMRIGRRLLDACDRIAATYGKFTFLEVFFIMVARANDLPVLELTALHPYISFYMSQEMQRRVAADLPAISHPFKNHEDNLSSIAVEWYAPSSDACGAWSGLLQ